MNGFSIYMVFVTAGLIAAPRRLPSYVIVAVIAVTAFFVQRDFVSLRADQQTRLEASTGDGSTVIAQVDDLARMAVASTRRP